MFPENCQFCQSLFSAKTKKALDSALFLPQVFGHYFFQCKTEQFFSEKEKPSPCEGRF